MEIGYALSELWRLKWWVALGLLVGVAAAMSVIFKLPSFEKKSYELGAASTEVVVEARKLPLGDIGSSSAQGGPSLVSRTALYSRLIGSPPVRTLISQSSGIPAWAIVVTAPPVAGQTGREVSSEERSNELLVEGNTYRVLAAANPELPVLSISTQAPTAAEAIKLANGAVEGLARFVHQTAQAQDVPPSRRLRFRQLGPAAGGTVSANADYTVAGLAFFGAFAAWCALVLILSRITTSWRSARAAEREPAAPQPTEVPVDRPRDDVAA